jgi:MFS transporter, OPA family, glycerol-3-phosphate transporter
MDTPASPPPAGPGASPRPPAIHARWRVLGQVWCLYAGYYLGRVNLAAAQDKMLQERIFTARQLGTMLAAHKTLYAIGQVVNGRLADKLPPRALLAAGLAGSGVANLAFSRLRRFPLLAPVWAANGLLQACGWTPVVRVIANWFPAGLRDAASGLIGTSYLLGSGLSWALSGWLTRTFDWPAAFRIPAAALLLLALYALSVRERPLAEADTAAQDPSSQDPDPPDCPAPYRSPRLWALAAGMAAFIFGHHGLLDWTPHYLAAQGYGDPAAAARTASWLPIGGTVGCLALTWLARGHRRVNGVALVTASLVGLAALTAAFPLLVEHARGAVPAGLWTLGALASAPASLMPCSMPADLVGTGAAGASAGLVDAMGYAGSAVSGLVTGWLLDGGPGGPAAGAWLRAWRTWPLGMVTGAALVWLAFRGL